MRRISLALAGLLAGCLGFFCLLPPDAALPVTAQSTGEGPLTGHVIGVDAGHGGYDGGCEGAGGVPEKVYNLQIALALGEAIEALGGEVVYTRTEDMALIDPKTTTGHKKRKELDNRIALLREGGAEALVSIHMNQYHSSRQRGLQLFTHPESPAGAALAEALQSHLRLVEAAHTRTPAMGEYHILTACDAAVLVECGFLSNAEDERLLGTEAHQKALAGAIAQGLADHFLAAETPAPTPQT